MKQSCLLKIFLTDRCKSKLTEHLPSVDESLNEACYWRRTPRGNSREADETSKPTQTVRLEFFPPNPKRVNTRQRLFLSRRRSLLVQMFGSVSAEQGAFHIRLLKRTIQEAEGMKDARPRLVFRFHLILKNQMGTKQQIWGEIWKLMCVFALAWILSCQGRPGSRQLPRRVEELDGVGFGPFGENWLLCDEAVSAVGGVLVQMVLCTLVPAACLVVVVGNLPVALSPNGRRREKLSHKIFLYWRGREARYTWIRWQNLLFWRKS